jgi:membrane protein YdbS with pleckstrin-like domain
MNIFKKSNAGKTAAGHHKSATAQPATTPAPGTDLLLKAMPSWWAVLFAYAIAFVFCYFIHKFFLWFPPYLLEVFKNLRGLPVSWADTGLFWMERGLVTVAVAAAVYHNLWQIGTRYKLTSHDLRVESWFPFRRVTAAPYGSVRRVGYRQCPLGFLFNYGQIEVDTGSPAGPMTLTNCPRPKAFMNLLQDKVESVLQPGLSKD